jgi:uncharacterized circularly permuted ATP-grasp superfamily protein
LKGDDLVVDNGRLMVRTVSGQQPISVLVAQAGCRWSDPLELEAVRVLGTPGLLGAVDPARYHGQRPWRRRA